MRRLYVELEIPDEIDDSDPVDAACLVLSGGTANVLRARWYPMGYDVPNVLTHVGWLNPNSGALHRNKMDLHPGRDWVRLFIYDPAQFAQVDGGEHCATLAEALERATWKVSFNLHTGERVRLVQQDIDGEVAFVLRPLDVELREALIERGIPADTAASLARASQTGWEQHVLDGAPGAVDRVAAQIGETLHMLAEATPEQEGDDMQN